MNPFDYCTLLFRVASHDQAPCPPLSQCPAPPPVPATAFPCARTDPACARPPHLIRARTFCSPLARLSATLPRSMYPPLPSTCCACCWPPSATVTSPVPYLPCATPSLSCTLPYTPPSCLFHSSPPRPLPASCSPFVAQFSHCHAPCPNIGRLRAPCHSQASQLLSCNQIMGACVPPQPNA